MSITASSWLEVDIHGLRRILERKGKAWAIFELVQNSWDTDATQVEVTLTKPNKNGKSTLTCRDNAPDGYRDLSEAHTLFGSSSKKADPTKRGRFNAGEKFVLVMCESAKVTSTTGQIAFLANGKRKENSEITTNAGTVFEGILEMTMEEWQEVGRQVQLLFPPIQTTYNGAPVPQRNPLKVLEESLPTEVANERGVLTPRKRKAEVRVYQPLSGETPMIYERGISVVEMDGKYHVSVEQKIPLNTERDNVTAGYLRNLHAIVLEHMIDHITVEDTTATWARAAVETGKLSAETVQKVAVKRFGDKAVLFDNSDVGSNKKAVSKGANVVNRGAVSPEERKVFYDKGALQKAGEVDDYKTNLDDNPPKKTLDKSEYTSDQQRYVKLIEDVSPILIGMNAVVKIIEDSEVSYRGCSRWGDSHGPQPTFTFEVNLAFHNCSDWQGNYYLLLHELAHHKVQSNDHLCEEFYRTVNVLGAKLTLLSLAEPELFPQAVDTVLPEPLIAVAA
jgi:Histidine kinase-, DNA gyrase B-, and HSP90-like ATPase